MATAPKLSKWDPRQSWQARGAVRSRASSPATRHGGCYRGAIHKCNAGSGGGSALGGGQNFGRDFLGLLGREVHRDLDALRFDKDADHALIGRTDLHVRLDVAFAVDAHDLAPLMLGDGIARHGPVGNTLGRPRVT